MGFLFGECLLIFVKCLNHIITNSLLFLVLSQFWQLRMRKNNFIQLLVVTLTVLPVFAFSQIQPDIPPQRSSGTLENAEEGVEPVIKLWQIDGFGAFRDSCKLDTLQDYFHLYHPVFEDAMTATYVGNYGTPYLNNNFFKRDPQVDFLFLETREAYMLMPEGIKYYNTTTPYTLLDFTQSEHRSRKNETRFNVLHTQNINPYFNVTFRYDQARSAGQYKNQETKNNFVTLYSSYDKDNLSFYGGFITNSIHNSENGGLEDDESIFGDDDTDLLNVNLSSSRSELGSTYFFATGEYRLGKYIETGEKQRKDTEKSEDDEAVIPATEFKPFAGILYSFEYQNHSKEFIDKEDSTNTFFPNTYYGEGYLKDSVRYSMVKNIIQIKQYEDPDRKTSFGKRAFIGQQFVKTSSPGSAQEIYNRLTKKYSNIYAGGGIFRETGSFWRWNFEGKVYLLGRNAGQTELSGIISKPLPFIGDSLSVLSITGRIENLVPDYYQEKYYSSHHRWNKDLKMEQRMTARGSFKSPKRNLELGMNYSIINNFIYNDTLGVPSQFEGQLLVLSAFADKDFNYRNLHFRTRLLWQKASNEDILHLPDFSAFVSAYYQFVVSKVLFTQIGVDTRFDTRYYADAYDPSTGFFYLQNEQKLGDFPYIDGYVSLRLKRTRVFFKMMNVGTEFINKPYFTTPHYPMNRMTFRLGVSWSFYD
jgi:hypothetical protein